MDLTDWPKGDIDLGERLLALATKSVHASMGSEPCPVSASIDILSGRRRMLRSAIDNLSG
jgi:hypothetical protein